MGDEGSVPILIAPFFAFAVGVALAWAGRRELVKEAAPVWRTQAFTVALFYGVFVLGPIVGYFAAFHGDWAYLYLVPWHHIPSAVDLAVVTVSAFVVPGAFLLAASPSRGRRRGLLAWLGGVPATVCVLTVLWGGSRLVTSATYAQFHGHFGGGGLGAGALGKAIVFFGLVLGFGTWTAFRRARIPESV
jgi:hypothetical protein